MNTMLESDHLDLIIDNNIIEQYQLNNTAHIFPLNTKVSLLQLELHNFSMEALGPYPYAFFPSLFTLNSEIQSHSGIDRVQQNPNLGLFGQGVLVGIIDTGIDYTHPAFRNLDGSSRIVSLWDQTITCQDVAFHPEGFPYGTLYTQDMLNQALSQENPFRIVPSVDEHGHGTMIAGLIAGNQEEQSGFSGVVPKSELVVVKLKEAGNWNKQIFCVSKEHLCFEENDVIAALSYMTTLAKQLRRPLAICIALGTSQGGHNGKGATSSYLNFIAQSPHNDVAIAGGNEGNKKRHFYGAITENFYTDFELHVSEKDPNFAMEIWVSSPYRISLDITTPTGETIKNLYPRLNECRNVSFVMNPSLLWINNIVSESDTGDQLILVRFQRATTGLWKFRAHSIDHEHTDFHVWLPANDIISNETYFLESNPDNTLTSPANADTPLCVTSYNIKTGNIASDSGRGYTRYGVIKPDLASPGVQLLSSFPKNQYQGITGTGAAAAIATGIQAMVLEWAVLNGQYTSISGSDINRLLIRGAYRTKQMEYPNKQWGYGAIDVYGLFEKLT